MDFEKPPIVEVLEAYGASFVPEGSRWRPMKCPFHDDRLASASVNTTDNRFRCFACDVYGDGYDVVSWKEGTRDFLSTVEIAERILGRSLRNVLPESQGQSRRGISEDARPKRGQRTIFQTRIRRKPIAGA